MFMLAYQKHSSRQKIPLFNVIDKQNSTAKSFGCGSNKIPPPIPIKRWSEISGEV